MVRYSFLMSGTRGLFRHLSLVVLAAILVALPVAAQTPSGGTASFTVLIGGNKIGTQTVSLTKSATGWLLSSFGTSRRALQHRHEEAGDRLRGRLAARESGAAGFDRWPGRVA